MEQFKTTDCYLPIDVNERLPQYPQIVVVLVGSRMPMMAQIRPSENGPEWWALGMANASRIEEKKKCVTHWLEPRPGMVVHTKAELEKIIEDEKWVSYHDGYLKGKEFGKHPF